MINYKLYETEHLSCVLNLSQEWFNENITFGIVPDTAKDIASYQNEYFYVALNSEAVIGYVTAEDIKDNEYNIFPNGASYLRVNDLYIAKNYRKRGIGEELLSLVEKAAYKNGLQHIFINSSTKDADAVRRFYLKNGYGIWTTSFYKRNDWDVRVFPFNELNGYRFVVIFARYQNKWLYCRAKERDTFETAGGRIEKGETPLEAAKRELYEETGAVKFEIKPAFDYSVHTPSDFSNGQVYLAYIQELGEIPEYEMAEVKLFVTIPDKTRFPWILPVLYERLQGWLNLQSAKDELWDVYDSERNLTGRTHRRADPLHKGDYHLVVHVWLQNSKGEFLISKRAPNKGYPNMWEMVGGSAIMGDDSISAAVREVKEEIGLDLKRENGRCMLYYYERKRY
jgi:8-oxo-dGTP diphosphatase